jgi:hypothetical protein
MSERLKKKTARVARWLLQLRADIDRRQPPAHIEQEQQDLRTCKILVASAAELIGGEATAELQREIERDAALAADASKPAPPAAP